jgi:hypothetical protein
LAAYVKYHQFTKDLIDGVHDFDGHAFRIALTNAAPNVATHTVRANITELATGNGYTQDSHATTLSTSTTGGVAKVVATDVTITATGSVGPFRYVVLYNTTPTSPADPLIAYWDYGSSITLANTETFTVDFDPTNGAFQIS